jgi:hypothetical protein
MRYELADYEWVAIKPMRPNKPRGVPRVNDRRILNGIFWVLCSGAPWRDLPEEGRISEHPAEKKSQRSDPLQPLSVLRPQPGREVLQQDQTMSSGGDALRQACRQLPCLRSTRVN